MILICRQHATLHLDQMQIASIVLVVRTEQLRIDAELAVLREVEERCRVKFAFEVEEQASGESRLVSLCP